MTVQSELESYKLGRRDTLAQVEQLCAALEPLLAELLDRKPYRRLELYRHAVTTRDAFRALRRDHEQ